MMITAMMITMMIMMKMVMIVTIIRCQQRVGLVAELVTSEEVVAGMVGMVQVGDDDDDGDEDHHHHHHHHHYHQGRVVLQHGRSLVGRGTVSSRVGLVYAAGDHHHVEDKYKDKYKHKHKYI